jgi:hypothetical protein
MSIETGQAIGIDFGTTTIYGVVMNVSDGDIAYYEINKIFPDNCGLVDRVRCYDDSDAVKERDQHHVRMVGCPPPMSVFGRRVFPNGLTAENIYVDANPERLRHLAGDKLKYIKVMDNGIKFGNMNMDVIYNHPWDSRTHREFLKKDLTELNKDETAEHAFGVCDGRRLPDIRDIEPCTDDFDFGK